MRLVSTFLIFCATLALDAAAAAPGARPSIVILYADDMGYGDLAIQDAYAIRHENWILVNAKTGAHSRVPDWVSEQQGYPKNEHAGELYDLGRDLGQKDNLYASRPDKVAELSRLLAQVRQQRQVR